MRPFSFSGHLSLQSFGQLWLAFTTNLGLERNCDSSCASSLKCTGTSTNEQTRVNRHGACKVCALGTDCISIRSRGAHFGTLWQLKSRAAPDFAHMGKLGPNFAMQCQIRVFRMAFFWVLGKWPWILVVDAWCRIFRIPDFSKKYEHTQFSPGLGMRGGRLKRFSVTAR